MKLSEGVVAALDAYEEFLILKDVRTKIDDMLFWARKRRAQYSPIYALSEYYVSYQNAWYIEVTRDRQSEAHAAVKAAAEKYKKALQLAWMPGAEAVLGGLGLPNAADIEEQVAHRPALWKWHYRIGYRWSPILPHQHLPSESSLLSSESKLYPLNVPDPSAAVHFWREIARESRRAT
ncbi:hypothetical protein [Mycobacteroides abscessus]|uniref:hypothetical protein n=1 Tax=Mycobacteroides abscessus TaxID=36809 RepID=UPI0005174E79|nr:hypothetical protein [Mycobacteroides abscessus]